MPALPVELNGGRIHEIAAPGTFSTTDSFRVHLRNRGEPVHAHLHLDDDLSQVARIETSNHYVEGENTRPVRVDVTPVESRVEGRLKVVTGYGAETAWVDVTVEPETEPERSVEVDETLSQPATPEPEPSAVDGVIGALSRPGSLSVLALAGVALAVSAAVGYYARDPVVLVGVGVVVGGTVAALLLALR